MIHRRLNVPYRDFSVFYVLIQDVFRDTISGSNLVGWNLSESNLPSQTFVMNRAYFPTDRLMYFLQFQHTKPNRLGHERIRRCIRALEELFNVVPMPALFYLPVLYLFNKCSSRKVVIDV